MSHETRPDKSLHPLELVGVAAVHRAARLSRQSALFQSAEGPFVFRRKLVHHVAIFKWFGQNVPGVGFHFEVRAGAGVCGKQIQDDPYMIRRVVKKLRRRTVQRDMKMNPPFRRFIISFRWFTSESLIQVPINESLSIAAADDNLMQVNILGKRSQRRAGCGGRADLQSGTQVNLADFDAALHQAAQRILRFLKFHGKMAGVIIDAQMLRQPFVARMVGAHAVEELNRLTTAFEQAEWFGFKAEMHLAAGLLAEARNVIDAAPEIVANLLQVLAVQRIALERAGQCADAGFDAGRRESREQIKQQVRVLEAPRRSPIGGVDVFFDSHAVELAEGKSVDGEDVALVFAEPALEFEKCAGVGEVFRGLAAEAQADAVGLFGAHALAHAQGILVERIECFRPGLAAVDIRAVGKMQARAEFH